MRFIIVNALMLAPTVCRAGEPVPPPASAIVDFSPAFISAIGERPSERVKPVRDCILGTTIRGCGLTKGQSRLELVPDPDRMVVDLVVTGQTWTDTVGTKGPVFVYNDREFAFEVRQRVFIDVDGVSLERPCARAKSEGELRCLTTKFKGPLDWLIKPVARRRYEKQKEEAGYIADRHAEEQYEEDLIAETEPQARDVRRRIAEGLEQLEKQGVRRDQLHLQTLHGAVRLTASVWPAGPVVSIDPPCPDPGDDVTTRVHQAFVNSLVRPRLAGRTLTENQIGEEIASLLGRSATQTNQQDESAPEWSLTLDSTEPIDFRFTGGQIVAVFKATEFVVENNLYPAMDVTARYAFQAQGERLVLRIVGNIEAYPAGFVPGSGKKLSARQIAVRSVVEKQLNARFPRDFKFDDVTLSGDLARICPLRLVRAEPGDGWLFAVIRRAAKAP